MPRLKSHSESGGLLLSHGSGSSRSSLALKLLLLGMGGCALLAAVHLPGRETVDASGSGGVGNMWASMGVSALVAGGVCPEEREGRVIMRSKHACSEHGRVILVPLLVLVCFGVDHLLCRGSNGRGRGRKRPQSREHPLTLHSPSPLPSSFTPQDIHSFAAAPAEPALPGASAAADVILPPDSSPTTTTTTNSSRSSSTATPPTPPAPGAVLLFPADAQLQDLTGRLVNANKMLEGKSVGLYFGAGWCSMTRAANPGVSAWVKAREAEGVTLGR